MNFCARAAIIVTLLPSPVLVLCQSIVEVVVWEKGTVLVKPCDLRFAFSEKWVPAPKGISNFPEYAGFMLGRMGVKDKQGQEIIPTIAMLWQEIDYVEMDAQRGKDVDPLFVYTMNNRPDARSKDFHLDRFFAGKMVLSLCGMRQAGNTTSNSMEGPQKQFQSIR